MADRTCSINDGECSAPGGRITNDWCMTHYKRWIKYGDPHGQAESELPPDLPGEHWRPIAGYEGLYQVSDQGRVRSLNRPGHPGRLLKQTPGGQYAYMTVKLCRDGAGVTHHVHRLVTAAFLGPLPEGWQTRHGSGGPLDNRLANLSYGPPPENIEDMISDGNSLHGSRSHFAKLTEEQVADIRRRVAAGETQKSAAQRYGVGQANVSYIMAGKTWQPRPPATRALHEHQPKAS